MTDTTFNGVAFAIGVQGAFGSVNGTVRDLDHTTADVLLDGLVLGDAESGDAESGVVLPNIVGQYRDVAKVAASFTESADSFQKAEVTGLAISFVMQGNGAAPLTAPGTGDLSVIMPGVEALFESAGLIGVAGAGNEEQDYTPRHAASAGGSTIYSTIKLWYGDLAYVFSDCLVESLEFVLTPGGFCIVTANILVGTYDATVDVDGFTFPTINYGIMASQAGPVVEGVAFTSFGTTRGFENLTITVTNVIEKFGDSNIAVSGERQAQTRRIISMTGTLYIEDTDSAAAHDNLVKLTAPTVDASFQVGTAGAAALNAFKVEVNNLQAKDIKHNRIGDALVVEINDSKATSTTVGTEFKLQMN